MVASRKIAIPSLLAALAGAAWAQVPDTALAALEEKVGILERKLELKDEEAAKKKDETPLLSAGKDGFSLKSPDGDFLLRWRGTVQADGRWFISDSGARWHDTWLLRRVDPVWEATAWKYYSFRVMVEFAGSAFSLQDAHVDLAPYSALKLRLGKFKAPIGLERLQSFPDAWTVENTYASALTPNRDVGAQLYGDLLGESVSYAAGFFNGAIDNANKEIDSTDHKTWAGRLWAQPFKNGNVELLRGLGLGFAASYGRQKGDSAATNLAAVRSPGQNSIFSYRTGARDSLVTRAWGNQIRINPHGYWFWNNLGLFGEYVRSSQEVSNRKLETGLEEEFAQQAWTVTGLWVLTGESPAYKGGVKPRHPFAPPGSGASATPAKGFDGFGALELVGHVSQFSADEDAFPVYANKATSVEQATTYGGGLTWYPVRNVKWLFNYEFTTFEGGGGQQGTGAAAVFGDRADEHVLFTRLQFGL